jgi:hypothetical protein
MGHPDAFKYKELSDRRGRYHAFDRSVKHCACSPALMQVCPAEQPRGGLSPLTFAAMPFDVRKGSAFPEAGKVGAPPLTTDRRRSLLESKECGPESHSHSAHQVAEPHASAGSTTIHTQSIARPRTLDIMHTWHL